MKTKTPFHIHVRRQICNSDIEPIQKTHYLTTIHLNRVAIALFGLVVIFSTGYEIHAKSKKISKRHENGHHNEGFSNDNDGEIKLKSVNLRTENSHANGKISTIENGGTSSVVVEQRDQETSFGKQDPGRLL